MTMYDRLSHKEVCYAYAGLLSRTEVFKHNYPFEGTLVPKFYMLWYANGYKTFKNKWSM